MVVVALQECFSRCSLSQIRIHLICLFSVLVTDISQWSMLLAALMVAFLLFATMSYEISLLRYSAKSATMSVQSYMYISLQLITDEHLIHQAANREESARLNVAGENFWGNNQQISFFDIRVFNPFTPSYHDTTIAQVLP